MPVPKQQIVFVRSDRGRCSLAFVKSAKITPPKGVKLSCAVVRGRLSQVQSSVLDLLSTSRRDLELLETDEREGELEHKQ